MTPLHRSRRGWWQMLSVGQRVMVLVVLFGALMISIGLIYVGPVTHIVTDSNVATPAVIGTDGPFYPPGTRYYYRRGQWQPFDQQESPLP